jgi:Cu2+-exporting ATPase
MVATFEHPTIAVCPGCTAVPAERALAGDRGAKDARLMLSVPTIHCASCI